MCTYCAGAAKVWLVPRHCIMSISSNAMLPHDPSLPITDKRPALAGSFIHHHNLLKVPAWCRAIVVVPYLNSSQLTNIRQLNVEDVLYSMHIEAYMSFQGESM